MRMRTLCFLFTAALALGISAPAMAYEANVGDRAQDFTAFDIVGRKAVHLEDHLGQWVLLDFWASWCGPCMRELPNLIEQTRPLRDSGKLVLITASGDEADTLPKLRKVIREQRIDFPVICDGGKSGSLPAREWGVYAWPSSFLINPQGVIVATHLGGDDLAADLAFFMDPARPVLGFRTCFTVGPDGTVVAYAELMNPSHEPVEVALNRRWSVWTADSTDSSGIRVDRHTDKDFLRATVSFDDFGEGVQVFKLEPEPGMNILGYSLTMAVPGSAGPLGASGRTELNSHGREAMLRGIEWKDSHWQISPEFGPVDIRTLYDH